jgi:hypothetical protein
MAASACCRISAGRLLEAALAGAAKVVRRLVQANSAPACWASVALSEK